ncbi:MAG: helix-turn-helix domain-containing protein [Chromatiaceae bacterium]|nr:helix-turn-helix domain-containing protein [Chromatiaceae bacterium]
MKRAGHILRLTKHEQRLLDTLIARRGQWVSTERLFNAVYDDPDIMPAKRG